jgi:DNA modification methylase
MSPEEREQLERSITEFGAVVPVVLNIGSRANTIIGGEQRIAIYADLGYTEVECMIPSRELTLEEERELNLRLNKNTGSWDEELLKAFDLEELLNVGFSDDELQDFFDDVEIAEDEYDVDKALEEMAEEPRAKLGDIWQLGQHRLLVGDSTDPEQVSKLMDGAKAHFVYLDSPYNIGLSYDKGTSKSKNYGGQHSAKKDSLSDEEYHNFLKASISTAATIALPDSHFLYWCDSKYIGDIQTIYKEHEITFRRMCYWVKNNQNVTYKVAFNRVHEPAVYGTIGKPHLNNAYKNANEILNQDVSSGNQLHDEILDMLDLWLVKRDDVQSYLHPTQKPVGLSEKPLRRCTAPGHVVFSGFGGSGSDLIACEQLNRKWYGVELDPVFASVIIDRWEKFTKLTAVRL